MGLNYGEMQDITKGYNMKHISEIIENILVEWEISCSRWNA